MTKLPKSIQTNKDFCIICGRTFENKNAYDNHVKNIKKCLKREGNRLRRKQKNRGLRYYGINIGNFSSEFQEEFARIKNPILDLYQTKNLIGMGMNDEWIVDVAGLISGIKKQEFIGDGELLQKGFVLLLNYTILEELIHSVTNFTHLEYSRREFHYFNSLALLDGIELIHNLIENRQIKRYIWDLLARDHHERLLEALEHLTQVTHEGMISAKDFSEFKYNKALRREVKFIIKIQKNREFWKILNKNLRWYPAYLDEENFSKNQAIDLLHEIEDKKNNSKEGEISVE